MTQGVATPGLRLPSDWDKWPRLREQTGIWQTGLWEDSSAAFVRAQAGCLRLARHLVVSRDSRVDNRGLACECELYVNCVPVGFGIKVGRISGKTPLRYCILASMSQPSREPQITKGNQEFEGPEDGPQIYAFLVGIEKMILPIENSQLFLAYPCPTKAYLMSESQKPQESVAPLGLQADGCKRSV
ncbi:unnamed protein product [Protopolystoma xenopodis]|uniref:Uncharacterized protein n=1 Tax=Protopolystoma xenopodis TaxID=117903 RepID=A0A3S5FEK9_9PLAT|nr:unnamed protein product [Protopolystoma xenopodis]